MPRVRDLEELLRDGVRRHRQTARDKCRYCRYLVTNTVLLRVKKFNDVIDCLNHNIQQFLMSESNYVQIHLENTFDIYARWHSADIAGRAILALYSGTPNEMMHAQWKQIQDSAEGNFGSTTINQKRCSCNIFSLIQFEFKAPLVKVLCCNFFAASIHAS